MSCGCRNSGYSGRAHPCLVSVVSAAYRLYASLGALIRLGTLHQPRSLLLRSGLRTVRIASADCTLGLWCGCSDIAGAAYL